MEDKMELKLKWFKSMNDFITVILMTAAGLFLVFSDKIVGEKVKGIPPGGIWVRADMYLRLLGGFLLFLTVLLFIKNLNFRKSETTKLSIPITPQAIWTILSLVVYTLLLRTLGFALDTFLVSFFLVWLYMRIENKNKILTRQMHIKMLLINAAFSLSLVLIIYVLFGMVLRVSLP
jgi:hypothetical protein